MQSGVLVVMDQHLAGVMTCTLLVTQDQTPNPTRHILVPPTTSHMVTLTEKPTQALSLAGATTSPHQKWKYFT